MGKWSVSEAKPFEKIHEKLKIPMQFFTGSSDTENGKLLTV